MGDDFSPELTDKQVGSLLQTQMEAEGELAALSNKGVGSRSMDSKKVFLKGVVDRVKHGVSPNGKTADVENVVK